MVRRFTITWYFSGFCIFFKHMRILFALEKVCVPGGQVKHKTEAQCRNGNRGSDSLGWLLALCLTQPHSFLACAEADAFPVPCRFSRAQSAKRYSRGGWSCGCTWCRTPGRCPIRSAAPASGIPLNSCCSLALEGAGAGMPFYSGQPGPAGRCCTGGCVAASRQ